MNNSHHSKEDYPFNEIFDLLRAIQGKFDSLDKLLKLDKELNRFEWLEGKLDLHIASPSGDGHTIEDIMKRPMTSLEISLADRLSKTYKYLEDKIEGLSADISGIVQTIEANNNLLIKKIDSLEQRIWSLEMKK